MAANIGIDIGGTKIAAGLVTKDGEILESARTKTPKHDPEAAIEIVIGLVKKLKAGTKVDSVGIGIPGFVSADRSTVLFVANLGWLRQPLGTQLEALLKMPVVVENDANAAAWGESRFGAGLARDNMVMVTIGTGIGGGIVMNGRLERGAHGVAAEFGHLLLVPGGRSCGCGKQGCWEQYGSGNALVRTARELAADQRQKAKTLLALGDGTPEGVQGLHITEAAGRGDEVALEAFRTVGTYIGLGLANIATLLDPAEFVIGGGVIDSGDLLMGPTRQAFQDALVAREHRPVTAIVPATLGNKAGIVGAADLARRST